MTELRTLTQSFIDKKISPVKFYNELQNHKDFLESLYPNVINIMSMALLYHESQDESISFCPRSGKNRRLKSFKDGFMKFCGNQTECPCNRDASRTRLDNISQEQQSITNHKRAKTNLQKYGDEFASKTDMVKQKAAATCIERYGAISPTQNPLVFEKVKKTLQENYGVEYPHQNPELASKAEQTWLQTRGVSRPAQDPEVRTKMKNTMIEKYGIEHNMHDPITVQTVRQKNRLRQYGLVISARTCVDPCFTLDEFIQGNSDTEWSWQCKSCKNIFDQSIKPGKEPRCIKCFPLNETEGESIIRQWLDANNLFYIKNDRNCIKPFELDFFLPQLNLAIEFNGIWWHSEKILGNKKYHFDKFSLAKTKNIKLIQIWEHDLHAKKDIIFQRLKYACGLITRKIGARSTIVQPISVSLARPFLNQHHLHGWHPSGKYWGCFYKAELVAVMSIGKNRYSKKSHYELTRFATKSDVSIAGCLSKMLASSKLQLGDYSLITYADLCWGHGNVYEQSGFVFQGYSQPNYWYFKNISDIKSRIAFQKHKISHHNAQLSESEIAESLGYNRFYDAGNSVWFKNV